MTGDKRWLDEGAPEGLDHLLRAAKTERPGAASVEQALAAVGVAATTAASTTTAAALQGAAGSAAAPAALKGAGGVMLVVKWGALGTAAGVLVLGAVQELTTPSNQASPPSRPAASSPVARPLGDTQRRKSPSAASSRTIRATADVPAPRPSSREWRKPVSRNPPLVHSNGDPSREERLAAEVRLVDRARAALRAGRAGDTLAALDEYDALPFERRFVLEALYLRMEASLALGREAQARKSAELLLRTYPSAPQVDRARAVLGRHP